MAHLQLDKEDTHLPFFFFFIDDGHSTVAWTSVPSIFQTHPTKSKGRKEKERKTREPTIDKILQSEKTWPSTFEHTACAHAHKHIFAHTYIERLGKYTPWMPCLDGPTRRLLHSSLHANCLISHLLSSLTHHSPFLPLTPPKNDIFEKFD
jgi:hypothetical protein